MVERKYMLGSDWVYCKIYTGKRQADILLATTLFHLIKEIESSHYIDKWFFIRYTDNSGFHLRIRLHLICNDSLSQIILLLKTILKPLIDSGLVSNCSFDMYNRELERYGAKTYSFSETLFYIDSLAIIRIINYYNGDDSELWKVALLLVDKYLDSFGLNCENKSVFSQNRCDAYRTEFNINNSWQLKDINNAYRKERRVIDSIMQKGIGSLTVDEIIQWRTINFKTIFESINWQLEVPLSDYLFSVVHMTINRLFRTNNRLCEMIIYEYLNKYYISLLKRQFPFQEIQTS